VHPAYWNSSVQNQSSLSAFYSATVTGAGRLPAAAAAAP
jgi:hypothetical protein